MSLNGQIGQYEILEILGSGAMGEVYRATDTKMFDRVVALKILSERLSQNEQACARFKREVEVASSLTHPHIVTIHDRGEHDGRPYFVMEYLEGTDLTELIRSHASRTIEQRIEMARQIADALQFAHRHNVVHRDVKPSNIMLTVVGGQEQTKLVDFGIAHIERSSLTRATTQPGTFSYMSPEQLKNDALDHRSDLFSLGIVLYELFTGTHPFDAPSEALITTRILRDEPEPARNRNSDVPAALDSLILKLLEKEPMQRPQTSGEVADALRQILRKLQTRGVATDPSEYSNLDDLTRQMVENLLTWARQKEAEGSLEEALKAYEKAHQLAPDSERLKLKLPRLKHRIESERKLRELLDRAREAVSRGAAGEAREHWRDAWILSPESEEVAALDREIEAAERTSPEDRERKEFVESHIRKVEEALDAGRTDVARMPLVEILKRYPNETLAGLMLDRLMVITASGIPYGEYRGILREAKTALGLGRFADAQAGCRRAQEIWRGDEEAISLEREIASRIQSEVGALVSRIERSIQEAEEPGRDDARAIESVNAALDALEKAAALGADAGWVRAADEQARRRKDEIEERARARERQEREREEQRRKVVGSFLQRGRNLHDEAEALRRRGLPDAERAVDSFQQARSAYSKVLEEEPENGEALEAIRRIDGARSDLEKEIESARRRRSEASGLASVARSALERARAGAEGDEEAQRRSLDLVQEGLEAAERALAMDPALDEAAGSRRELVALGTSLREETARREAARKEIQSRREATIGSALAEGRGLLGKMEPLVSGDLDELAKAEEVGLAAEVSYRKVLALDPDQGEAKEALQVLASYVEHARSELQRRRKEADERARESAEQERRKREAVEAEEKATRGARQAAEAAEKATREAAKAAEQERRESARAEKLRAALSSARQALDEAQSLGSKGGEEGDRLLKLIETSRGSLREATEIDPGNAEARKLAESLESLSAKVSPEIEKARRRAALVGVREKLEKSRGLAKSGKHREALTLLAALDQECRPYEWLHEAMPEIQRLRQASEGEQSRGRRKLMLFGGAGALVVVLAVAGIAFMSGGGSKPAPSRGAADTPPSAPVRREEPAPPRTTPPDSTRGEAGRPSGAVEPVQEVRDVTEPGPPSVPVAPSASARPPAGERPVPAAMRTSPAVPAPRPGSQPETLRTPPDTRPPALPPPVSPQVSAPAPVETAPAGTPAGTAVSAAATRFEGEVVVDEKPVGSGYAVVFESVGTKSTVEARTAANGHYSVEVAPYQRHKLVKVVAPDGAETFSPKDPNVPRSNNTPGKPVEWNLRVYSRK